MIWRSSTNNEHIFKEICKAVNSPDEDEDDIDDLLEYQLELEKVRNICTHENPIMVCCNLMKI
jgi:hypothetical protein